VVARVVAARDVRAPVAVQAGVHVVATAERPGRVVGPLVEIADHVERAIPVRTLVERAGERDGSRQLVELRIVHVNAVPDVRVREAVEMYNGVPTVIFVAGTSKMAVAVRVHRRLGAATRPNPLVVSAQSSPRGATRPRSLGRTDVSLRNRTSARHSANSNADRAMVGRPGALGPVLEHLDEGVFEAVDAVLAANVRHSPRAAEGRWRTAGKADEDGQHRDKSYES